MVDVVAVRPREEMSSSEFSSAIIVVEGYSIRKI